MTKQSYKELAQRLDSCLDTMQKDIEDVKEAVIGTPPKYQNGLVSRVTGIEKRHESNDRKKVRAFKVKIASIPIVGGPTITIIIAFVRGLL